MNQMTGTCPTPSAPRFTSKQGQYLAFIHAYTQVLGRPPAEADLQRRFHVTPPSVHQMVLTLERAGRLAFASSDFASAGAGWFDAAALSGAEAAQEIAAILRLN